MPGTTTFFQNVSRKYYPCQRAQCPTRVTARMRRYTLHFFFRTLRSRTTINTPRFPKNLKLASGLRGKISKTGEKKKRKKTKINLGFSAFLAKIRIYPDASDHKSACLSLLLMRQWEFSIISVSACVHRDVGTLNGLIGSGSGRPIFSHFFFFFFSFLFSADLYQSLTITIDHHEITTRPRSVSISLLYLTLHFSFLKISCFFFFCCFMIFYSFKNKVLVNSEYRSFIPVGVK